MRKYITIQVKKYFHCATEWWQQPSTHPQWCPSLLTEIGSGRIGWLRYLVPCRPRQVASSCASCSFPSCWQSAQPSPVTQGGWMVMMLMLVSTRNWEVKIYTEDEDTASKITIPWNQKEEEAKSRHQKAGKARNNTCFWHWTQNKLDMNIRSVENPHPSLSYTTACLERRLFILSRSHNTQLTSYLSKQASVAMLS